MESIFGTLLAFFIVFGILVFIHEFGHFFTAKLVGIRVETFSFGYGKRLFGVRRGETDYRISLIPMGGYVKFLGEGELFAEGGQATLPPDHFLAKTRWQRFLVMAMGSVMNLLLAVVLIAVVGMVGVSVPGYQEERPVIGWIEAGSPAEKAGFNIGDEILSIDGEKVASWGDVELAVGSKPDRDVSVELRRGGENLRLAMRTEKKTRYALGYAGFTGDILTQVKMVKSGSPADKAGLRPGDIIRSIDGRPINFYEFVQVIEKNPDRSLTLDVQRGGEPVSLTVTPRLEGSVGRIGIYQEPQTILKKFGFFAAFGQSLTENAKNAFLIVRFIKDLFVGRASTQQLGGPIDIANFSYAALKLGFIAMLSWIGLISLQLGIINLFPIPVFDGGQIFVLAIEAIIRRDLGPKVRQVWMQVGFVIFVLLIVFVILNDIVKRLPAGWQSLVPW